MYGAIITLAFLGLALNYVLHLVEKFFTSWNNELVSGE
jgi:ABC-type nitrate/sulfonate/bicarbonate transport system permease component